MMKKLKLLPLILSLGFSANVITNNGVQYYSRPYVENIIDYTVASGETNRVEEINSLKKKLAILQNEQIEKIEEIKRLHRSEVAILNQKHDLEIKAEQLKGNMKTKGWFFGGLFTGIGASVGTAIFVNSFDFPLFKIQF